LKGLLEVFARPEDEAETDNAIENDHHICALSRINDLFAALPVFAAFPRLSLCEADTH
jgi:hypothetical protein